MEAIEKPKPSIGKFFKWTGIIIGLIIIVLIIIATVFEREIGAVVIKTINKQLKTELQVEDAKLSLIRQFPKAAVYLNNVHLSGAGNHEEKLLSVEALSLKCSIWGLLTGNYDFNSIAIDNGHIFVHTDKKGKTNYDVFKSSEEVQDENVEGGDLALSISNATMKNVAIHYVDEGNKQDIKLLAKSAYFEGDFMIDNTANMDKHEMRSYAELYSDHVILDEVVYFKGKDFAYDGAINIDNSNGLYTFNQIKLYLSDNEFQVDGSIATTEKGTEYNIVFDSEFARLNSLLHLLPAQYTETLGLFESHAKLTFDARVNGLYSKKSRPIVEVNFGLKEGRLTHPQLAGSMKDVKFDVHFTNGNGKDDNTAKLVLKDFQAFLNDQPVHLQYQMVGIDNPLINLSLDGNLPVAAIYGFLGENVTDGSGTIKIEKLQLEGRMEDMMSMHRIPRVRLDGLINFDQVNMTVNEIPTTIEMGKMGLSNNVFNVSNLILSTPNNHAVINGAFNNVIPVLLSDSINTYGAKITFNSSLHSNKMDFDELMALSGNYTQEEIEDAAEEEQDSLIKENYASRESTSSFLEGTFVTNILELKYGNVLAKNFNGEVAFEKSVMNLKGVKVDMMDGQLELNSKVHFTKEPYVEAFLDCHDLDIQKFFDQFESFGQEVLTGDNIHGRLNSLIKVNMFFDSLGNFLQDQLFVLADVNIKNGELINLEMLNSFAGFIKLQDLKYIKFTELNNQFKIENSRLHIPAMFIQSNALNLVIGGDYAFNHDMDFKVKINAGQVLATKFKKYNPDKEPLKAKQKGLFNIYARIFGNLYADIDYKLGPKDTKKALEAEMSSQLPSLMNTLKSEFNKSGNTGDDQKVRTLKQPDEWDDIPEFDGGGSSDDLEYLDGF